MLTSILLFLLIGGALFDQSQIDPDPDPDPLGLRPIVTRIRLAGGSSPWEGRVEVEINGTFGTVCDDDFTDVTAKVVCRSLNLTGGTAKHEAFFGHGAGPIYMDNIGCKGYEKWLGLCPFVTDYCPSCTEPTNNVNCRHNEDVGVICNPGKNATGSGGGGVVTQTVEPTTPANTDAATQTSSSLKPTTSASSTPTPTATVSAGAFTALSYLYMWVGVGVGLVLLLLLLCICCLSRRRERRPPPGFSPPVPTILVMPYEGREGVGFPGVSEHRRSVTSYPSEHRRSVTSYPNEHRRSFTSYPSEHRRSVTFYPSEHQSSVSSYASEASEMSEASSAWTETSL